jgi:hypothetical protein
MNKKPISQKEMGFLFYLPKQILDSSRDLGETWKRLGKEK